MRKVSKAWVFIFMIGIVSLFADMTHEGARSIYGAYLAYLGISAAGIGFISGLGEMMGYSLRLIFGYLSDKTQHYWNFAYIGYFINVLAIPALALIDKNGWILACILIVLERVGKAIRQPSKNTLLSFASSQVGAGKAFAIQEFLDQIGAFIGPLLLFIVISLKLSADQFNIYQLCFGILGIPAVLTLLALFFAHHKFPNPDNFEVVNEKLNNHKLPVTFSFYLLGIGLLALGFIDFPLITYHIAKNGWLDENILPLVYSIAMLADAFSALIFGWFYDKYRVKTLVYSSLLSSLFSIFIFLTTGGIWLWIGVILWGIGMGAQESILKSVVAEIVQKKKRAFSYGMLEMVFGVTWFLGSWLLGVLYDVNIYMMVIFSVLSQWLAVFFFKLTAELMERKFKHNERSM